MTQKPTGPTEKSIQEVLWLRHFRSIIAAPCSGVLGHEADMVVVTRALIAHEFEIKLTRADFKSDAKKDKFAHFARWMSGQREYLASVKYGPHGQATRGKDSRYLSAVPLP